MSKSCRDGAYVREAGDLNRSGGTERIKRNTRISTYPEAYFTDFCCCYAQLTVLIVSPRPDRAVGFKRYGMSILKKTISNASGRDSGYVCKPAYLHRRGAVCCRTVTKLADPVLSPRPHRAVGCECDGVVTSGRYCGDVC